MKNQSTAQLMTDSLSDPLTDETLAQVAGGQSEQAEVGDRDASAAKGFFKFKKKKFFHHHYHH